MTIPVTIDGKVQGQVLGVTDLREIPPYLDTYPSLRIVYDISVRPLAMELRDALSVERGEDVPAFAISCSEEGKTLHTVQDICNWLLDTSAQRSTLLLAIGGGICTDMAGFAACIYKRGIPFAFLPTTLLAQVDAAIGGKTGVNFQDFKNMLGVISQPVYTFECPTSLLTLPYREFLGGAAELLKTFVLDEGEGKVLYEETVSLLGEVHALGLKREERLGDALLPYLPALGKLIGAAASVKASVVSEDPYERGRRKVLNLGHTFAHGIEHEARVRGDAWSHGEAVSMGMVLCARLSSSLGLCTEELSDKIRKDLSDCGLPVECPYPISSLRGAMSVDKKARGGKVPFILIGDIGDVRIVELEVDEAIERLER